MTVEIPLSRGFRGLVDDEDVPLFESRRWYVVRTRGLYLAARINCRQWLFHRIVLGAKPGEYVDHINGNGLDNRRVNLRTCTKKENSRNVSVARGASGLKGVTFDPRNVRRPWQSRIRVDYDIRSLGTFETREEAAAAYDSAAVKFFGAFAKTNHQLGLLPSTTDTEECRECLPTGSVQSK